MHLKELPLNYLDWLTARDMHLNADLEKSNFTEDLFKQYKKHLGAMRFAVLVEAQKLVCPHHVKQMLNFNEFSLLSPAVPVYKVAKLMKIDWLFRNILLPPEYKQQIDELDVSPL